MDANTRIGDYEILGELGRGGMGRVFRVRNVIADRVEAMKVLLPDLVGRQDLATRFLREIKVLAALNHPNIAALRTALTAENQLVMIMEFVEGQSLAERLEHGPIAPADALAYVDQVLDALAYSHERGVVHRDIKPANMMLTPQGVVKLTDFGIARSATDDTLTAVGTTTGSLSYMSPEQVNGEPIDARSDLYSVGISLYEMVTGQRPFKADSDFHVMLAHLKQVPRPPAELQPSIPAALNALILRAIAKGTNERFQSAHEFREALRGVPTAGLTATASRQATVMLTATAPVAALGAAAPRPPTPASMAAAQPSDHARTVLDTRTPVAPPVAAAAASTAPVHATPQPDMRSGHPLLFVALGAMLVIGALVGTGLYLGRAEAGPGARSDAAAEVTPEAEPAASEPPAASPTPTGTETPPTPAPIATTDTAPAMAAPSEVTGPPPAAPTSIPAAAASDAARRTAPRAPAATPASTPSQLVPSGPPARNAPAPSAELPAAQEATPAPRVPAAAAAAELDAIDQEVDQIAARAGAVHASLDRMREQQARQGLGLRGDIAARQQSLRINLARAEDALDKGDPARAAKYRDAAQSDVAAIERFLGR